MIRRRSGAVLMAMIRCVQSARGRCGEREPQQPREGCGDGVRRAEAAHKEAELKEEAARRARELEERREMILGRADGEK